MTGTLLAVRDLKVHFPLPRGWLAPPRRVHAVDGVSFTIERGRTLGLVGESGSGKTTVALAVMRLVDVTSGEVRLHGRDLAGLSGEALRAARRHVQMIFQDPYSSLNPRARARDIVGEPLELMRIGDAGARQARVRELFTQVGLRPDQMGLFPHQFSGGQRIGIARALSTQPDLIVCDEPVSALDVAIQAQILNLLARLQREFGLAYLFISHDLGVVQHLCDEVAVMYLGRIVERAPSRLLFADPKHPYTWALLSAVPRLGRRRATGQRAPRLEGDPPSPIDLPRGCRFAGRCRFAEPRCHDEPPELRAIGKPVPGSEPNSEPGTGSHSVACHLVGADGSVPHRPAEL